MRSKPAIPPVSRAVRATRRRGIPAFLAASSAHGRGQAYLQAVQRGAVLPPDLPLHALAQTLEAEERVEALGPRRVMVRVIRGEQDVVLEPVVDDVPGQVLVAVSHGVALAAEV